MDMMWSPWHLPMAKAREFAYVGDSISGAEMARLGWANYAVPADQLEAFTRRFAERMAHIDNDMLMYSKRSVNRQYEVMGIRTGLWSGTELQGLSSYRPAASEWGRRVREQGLKAALEWRDGPFRDFRGAYDSAPKDRPVATGESPRGG
jgi:enoyl-CoA hydratase